MAKIVKETIHAKGIDIEIYTTNFENCWFIFMICAAARIAIFDCFDSGVIGLAMDTNMKADLCERTVTNAVMAYPDFRGSILHSDRGAQYTSATYRAAIARYDLRQSMNSAGGRCHDNARCESMWARMKSELLYGRYDREKISTEDLKSLIWRYFMGYWNHRRICSVNGGLPPMKKRQQYYDSLKEGA